jgi:hypothetical protein
MGNEYARELLARADAAESRAAQTRNALQFACDQLAELLGNSCPHGTCPGVEGRDPAQCDLTQKAGCIMGACEAAVTLADGGVPDPSCCMSVVGIIITRAAQAERQVRVLAEELVQWSARCPAAEECPNDGTDKPLTCINCAHALPTDEAWQAWSSAQAAQEVGS